MEELRKIRNEINRKYKNQSEIMRLKPYIRFANQYQCNFTDEQSFHLYENVLKFLSHSSLSSSSSSLLSSN